MRAAIFLYFILTLKKTAKNLYEFIGFVRPKRIENIFDLYSLPVLFQPGMLEEITSGTEQESRKQEQGRNRKSYKICVILQERRTDIAVLYPDREINLQHFLQERFMMFHRMKNPPVQAVCFPVFMLCTISRPNLS